jgi:hypothetical protein
MDCGFTCSRLRAAFTVAASKPVAGEPNAVEPTTWGSVKALYR